MNKRTIFVVIALVSAVILGLIWGNRNVENGVTGIERTTNKLFAPGMINKRIDDPAVKPIVDSISNALRAPRYAIARPGLQASFDAFKKAWSTAGPLTKQMQADQKTLLGAQFNAKTNMQWNQLLGLFLDWLFWMLALGLCFFSNILRDSVGDDSAIQRQTLANQLTGNPPANPPYSLARTQLVLWVTIIASVYAFAVLWDGRGVDTVNINTTALILMGISAGTFTAGAIIDTSEIQQGIPRIQDQPSTNNFLKDILSDEGGISIHRFQNLVWTLVAIVIYFYRYAHPPAGSADILPVLDNTLLALTGISSATYLTMKTRENVLLPQLKIRLSLSPANTLPPAVVTALASGFPGAVINIVDAAGNTIHPVPDAASPNFDYSIANLAAGTYAISVTWTGIVPPGAAAATTLTGSWKGQIDKTTTNPLPIAIK